MRRGLIGFIVAAVGLLMPPTLDARPITLAWDPSPDTVAGYIIFYGTQPGTYSNSIDVGNLLSYQLDLPGDQYYFVVCAYDAAAARGGFSNEVAESSAIALTNPGDQTDGTGASVSLSLVATGSPTSYTAAPLPSGLGIDPSTGVIRGIIGSGAAASSPYVVRATASNAAGNTSSVQFTWTIAGVNRAPTVTPPGDQTTAIGTAASLAIVASDPDGDTLAFSASGLPAGLSIDAASGAISGVPSGPAGAFSVTVTASDGSLTGSSTFTWTVTKGANRPPTLTAPSDQASAENSTVSLQLVASDPDGDALTYGASGLPRSLTVNAATGLISGTLDYTNAGTYSVTAIVSDGTVSVNATFTWTVTNVDRAPTVTPPGDQTTAIGTAASLAIVASDPDGDTLAFSASGLPAGLSIDAASGAISGVPSGPAGAFSVTVTASDGSLTGSSTFTWTVTKGPNRAPTLTAPGDQASAENSTVSLQLVASDPDGDALTYGASGLPGSLTVNAATGLISGTLDYTSAGTYSVTAIVSDGTVSVSATLMWTVTNTDRAPALAKPPDQTSIENATVSLQLAASDPDGDPLTYDAGGLPPSLSVDRATGIISGTLAPASAGTYTVTVTASDGTFSRSENFVWTVTHVNQAPTLTSPGPQTSRVGTAVVLPVVAADPEDDALTFSAIGLPGALHIDATTGVITGTVIALPGSYQVTVFASDGALTASQTFTWTVTLL